MATPKNVRVYCAALDCVETPDRTVMWSRDNAIVDYSHECKDHAIDSATNPFAFDGDARYKFAAVFAGIRRPFVADFIE